MAETARPLRSTATMHVRPLGSGLYQLGMRRRPADGTTATPQSGGGRTLSAPTNTGAVRQSPDSPR